MTLSHRLVVWLAAFLAGAALAQIPPEVDAALTRAKLPREALSLLVVDAEGQAPPRLSHRAQVPMNPASLMKLVTTYVALEQLGPSFSWSTPVYLEGVVREGTLYGNLHIKGQGDPKLVMERLWLLLRRVRGLGVQAIAGDIVLDRSAFEVPEQDPASFDGEPLRPYNAAPDALLVNFKSLLISFVPERSTQLARILVDPPLAGVQLPASVPLSGGDCNDYRGALRADFSDPARIRFAGSYPAACGERAWPVAYADPQSYARRVVQALWMDIGGQLAGQVREGRVPAGLKPAFELSSPPLAEVVRDINKYSNNVMAQQLFLTLSLQQRLAQNGGASAVATLEASRELVRAWWKERFGEQDVPTLDNGSGLSRHERISAQALARLLQAAWRSPLMPELGASLPITGVDGTLRRARSAAAHLKTGSLRDVAGVAGYVHAASGQRYVLVAIANHANAQAARPAFDALLDWTVKDQ